MEQSLKPLRILFVTPYYPPEMGAPQARISELAVRLVRRGHTVTVLTGFPSYPSGIIPPEYRGKLFQRENRDGVNVVRTWIYPTSNQRLYLRLVSYFSFVFSSILGSFRCGGADIVYVESPPLFDGIAGCVIAAVKRAPFLFNVADLWPDFAVELGLVRKGLPLALAYRLEAFIYRKAARVATVTRGLIRRLRDEKRVPEEKLVLFRNGVDLELFSPDISGARVRERLGLAGKFVVGFIGNIGHWQGLETVVDAAALLRDRTAFHFLIVGDGARREAVGEYIARQELANITMLPVQPKSAVPELWAACDCAVIPLRKVACAREALPAKMFEALAAGKPIVLGIRGEAEEVMRNAAAGVFAEPENPQSYAEAFARLAGDEKLRRKMGVSGRAYAEKHFDRDALTDVVEEVFMRMAAER